METICIFVGDVHTGGASAVTPNPQNDRQYWLLATWDAAVKRMLALARGRRMLLMLGGDLEDLPSRQARLDAITLLRPLAAAADEVWGVPGTEYHVGEDGEEDRSVYDEFVPQLLRAQRVRQVHRLRIAGRVLVWGHHAARLGMQPWTEYDGLYRAAKAAHEWAKVDGDAVPDLLVAHHVHRSPAPGWAQYRTTRAAICGCWQLQTPYGAKRVPLVRPTIGALAWWPEQDRLESMTYVIPEELISA